MARTPPSSQNPYRRQQPPKPKGPRAQRAFDAAEKVGNVLIDVAAEALEVGVRGALGSLLGRATGAAEHAAEALKKAKERVNGDE
jgi:hypothetical protein